MIKFLSIKIKAAILFVVFGLNSFIGFACAVGIDDCFTMHHHNEESEETTQFSLNTHADGKKHHHHDEKNTTGKDDCCNKEKDHCCNKNVVLFEHLDKTISHGIHANFNLPFFDLPPFLLLNTAIYNRYCSVVLTYILRNFHAPPEDIRVSIRSFQI
jgi:hypothetical protein